MEIPALTPKTFWVRNNRKTYATLPIWSAQCRENKLKIYNNSWSEEKKIQDKHFCKWHRKHLKYYQNLSTVLYSFIWVEKYMVLIEIILVCNVNFI